MQFQVCSGIRMLGLLRVDIINKYIAKNYLVAGLETSNQITKSSYSILLFVIDIDIVRMQLLYLTPRSVTTFTHKIGHYIRNVACCNSANRKDDSIILIYLSFEPKNI